MANSNNWGEIYKSTWWGDEDWSANSLKIDSAPPGFAGQNLLLGSEELGSTGVGRWNQDLMNAVNSDQVNNPAGTEQTADQLDFQASKSAKIKQDVTLVVGTEYTFSVWARAASGTQPFRLRYYDNVGSSGGASAFTASATWSPTTGRYSFTFTAQNSGTFTMMIQNAADAVSRRIYFWGAMLNEGATAGDYIKTEFTGPSSPATPPMEFGDNFVGVTAYYSLRRFTIGEDNNAIRVRRSSDDTEQDIGFDANGDLDTTALTTFVNADYDHYTSDWSSDVDGWTVNNAGGGTVTLSNDTNRLKVDVSGMTTTGLRPALNFPSTIWSNITEGCSVTIEIEGANLVVDGLFVDGTFQNITDHDLDTGTFTYNFTKAASNTAIIYFNSTGKGDYVGFLESVVITQTTADGAVTTFYDQSGNGNDATNATESEQPLIVDAGTLVTENGKAAVDFDGVDDYLQNTSLVSSTPTTHYLVAKANSTGTTQRFTDGGVSSSTRHSIFQNASQFQYFAGGIFTGAAEDTNQNLHYFLANGTSSEIAINGATASIGSGGTNTLNGLTFAARWDGAAQWGSNSIQELILFNSDQSSNRTTMETNINDHFDIYP